MKMSEPPKIYDWKKIYIYRYVCPFKIPNSSCLNYKEIYIYGYKNIYGYCARWTAELIGGAVGTSCIGTYIVPYPVTLLLSYPVTLLLCYLVNLLSFF